MIPEDKKLITDYVSSKELTERTKQDYVYTLSLFADFLENDGGLLSAGPADFDNWAGGLAPATYNCYLGIIRPFYKWCMLEDYCNAVPIIMMCSRPKKPTWKRRRLTEDEAEKAISSLESTRDIGICRLALQCGLGNSQIALLNIGAFVRSPSGPVLCCGPRKGAVGHDYVIELDPVTASVIAAQVRSRIAQGAKESDPLFASLSRRNAGERLSQRSIVRVVSDALASLGLSSMDIEASFGSRTRGERRRCLVPCPSCAALNGRCPLE